MPHISDPLLQAYIDGFCSDVRVDEIESHIEGCSDCRERLESARDAAQRASQLLGTLDPGPVHAPSFEELQARASARAGDAGTDAAGASDVDRAAVIDVGAGKIEPPLPFWRRPAMAWAATLVIAFGLGWLSNSRLNLPTDITAPSSPAFDGPGAETPAPASEPAAPGEAGLREGLASGDELDDLESAAKRTMAAEIEPAPAATEAEAVPPGPPPAAIEGQVVPRQQVAENRAAPGAAGAQTAAGQRLAAVPPPAEEIAPLAAASLAQTQPEEMNERRVGAVTFADAGVTPGFVAVALEDAEMWLGVAPREIPDLTLLRVEVGPGTLVESGILSRAAIRLVYVDPSGQQVALLQQYAGAIEQPELAQMGQVSGGRASAADTPARAERARETEEFRADRKAGADRDAVVDGVVDLPAYVREPDGRVTYRWRDADGYVLSISGDLDPDVLRGLADRIR